MDNGILVKRNLAVRQKLMEWRITFTLDNPNPEMEYKLLTSIHNLKQSLIALTDPKDQERLPIQHWLNLLNEMEGETRSLMHRRKPRALLPIIGDISHDLFVTATTREINEIMAKVSENRDTINKLVNFQKEQLTLINVTFNEMKNRQAINDLIAVTSSLQERIDNITHNAQSHYYTVYRYNIIQDHINTL